MRTQRFASLFVLAGIALIVTSCSESLNGVDDSINFATSEKSSAVATTSGYNCTFSGILSEDDSTSLIEMREEEKLAGDVYTFFYETYNHQIFSNISISEDSHTNAVLFLINGYNLTDPAPENAGEYYDARFTKLYTDLTLTGSVSLVEALKIGALIEETDIEDLKIHLGITENEDIIQVYSNLLEGSKSHLRAFVKVLAQLGEIYPPAVIPADEYQAILDESTSKGKHGNNSNSQGTGNNNNYGNNSNTSGMGNNNYGYGSTNTGTCDGNSYLNGYGKNS